MALGPGASGAAASLRAGGLIEGSLLFARYAYPPNQLGYCGPEDHRALLEYGATGISDGGLTDLARGFLGAWPYLQLIAETTGVGNPLDRRVVHAYWIGNSLLDQVDRNDFGNSLRDRFRPRTGLNWSYVEETLPAGAVPHHSFHVFGIYPWVGLLRGGRSEEPLHVLDRCRIRWGEVVAVEEERAVVRSSPLTWDGRRLALGPEQLETARYSADGYAFRPDLRPGDQVSLHWDWVCDVLGRRDRDALERYTRRQLDITNTGVSRSGPAAVLA